MRARLTPWVACIGFLTAGMGLGAAAARPIPHLSPFVATLDPVQWVSLAFVAMGRGTLALLGVG